MFNNINAVRFALWYNIIGQGQDDSIVIDFMHLIAVKEKVPNLAWVSRLCPHPQTSLVMVSPGLPISFCLKMLEVMILTSKKVSLAGDG